MHLVAILRRALPCLLAAGLVPCIAHAAAEPGVRAEILNGAVRVVLDGSYSGARYSVGRSETAGGPIRLVGERDALCTGDCYVLDSDVLAGATYWYRFDLVTAEGARGAFGRCAGGIGPPANGLPASPSPNPLSDRGTLRVTAAIPAGARAG